ncbi:MAG: hypothetical protein M1312_02240 [Patescibacteria group bacterium]|nr:hypothetical protein [Patescibacteria group bacterium]
MMRIKYFTAAVIATGIFISLGLTVSAQVGDITQSGGGALANVTFPISELGNCSSQSACQTYCSDTSHMRACIQFAEKQGIVSSAEASKEKAFADVLSKGGGPGGCTSPDSCNTYCSDINHLQACMSFAQSHGLSNNQISQGQKILTYLQSGGKMPGGCTSQDTCQTYCNDLSHAEECFAFSQKLGITPPNNGGPQPTLAQMQKIAALAQSGQTPGGCDTMEACQSYCNDPSHGQVCQKFGQEVGFTGGPNGAGPQAGPGGCDSAESCQTYCNDSSHQTECLQFAQEHGIMTQGQVHNFQNGIQQFQNGLKNSPPQVLTCLQDQVGAQVLSQMQNGQFTPTPDVMSKMQTCFQSFQPSTSTPNGFNQNGSGPQGQGQGQGHEMTVGEIISHMPPKVYACVQGKLNGNLPVSSAYADQSFGAAVQSCYAANPPTPGPNLENQGNQQNLPPMSGNEPMSPQPQQGNYNNYNVSGTPPIQPFQPGSSSTLNSNYQQPQNQPAPLQPYVQPNASSTLFPPPGSMEPMPGTQTQSSSIQSLGGEILNAISNLLR